MIMMSTKEGKLFDVFTSWMLSFDGDSNMGQFDCLIYYIMQCLIFDKKTDSCWKEEDDDENGGTG